MESNKWIEDDTDPSWQWRMLSYGAKLQGKHACGTFYSLTVDPDTVEFLRSPAFNLARKSAHADHYGECFRGKWTVS